MGRVCLENDEHKDRKEVVGSSGRAREVEKTHQRLTTLESEQGMGEIKAVRVSESSMFCILPSLKNFFVPTSNDASSIFSGVVNTNTLIHTISLSYLLTFSLSPSPLVFNSILQLFHEHINNDLMYISTDHASIQVIIVTLYFEQLTLFVFASYKITNQPTGISD